MTEGVPAGQLSEDDLLQQLAHLKEKQSEIQETGTADQKANHAQRTTELENEFLKRYPEGRDIDREYADAAARREAEHPPMSSM